MGLEIGFGLKLGIVVVGVGLELEQELGLGRVMAGAETGWICCWSWGREGFDLGIERVGLGLGLGLVILG